MSTTALAVLILAVGVLLAAMIVVAKTVRVIQQGTVGVVKRLGQFRAIHNPGLVFIAPFVDDLVVVDVREVPRTGDRQEVITRDNVSVAVNATIFSQVVDPKPALFSVSNFLVATDQLARTTLRSVFGSLTLDEALSQRERINAQLQQQMESVTDKWGVRINRVEIVDITPPAQILQALALQKTADQEKRAAILQSEGQQQSAINLADGQRQAAIKQAEGQKEAAILRAEGNRQAAILEAEGRAQAIATVYTAISTAHPDQTLVAILQLDTLGKFADSKAGTIVVPYEAAGLMGAATALRGVLGAPGGPGPAPAPSGGGGPAQWQPPSAPGGR
ncbi:MAG TPA: SPFH domain-containing protein [Candidatus Dormibacteraeota bacterium]|nr:SPFH domain-containing protein [Candidatus Dormibacteraeota bacterium]